MYMCVMGCLKERYWSRREPHFGLWSRIEGVNGGDDRSVTKRLEDTYT